MRCQHLMPDGSCHEYLKWGGPADGCSECGICMVDMTREPWEECGDYIPDGEEGYDEDSITSNRSSHK